MRQNSQYSTCLTHYDVGTRRPGTPVTKRSSRRFVDRGGEGASSTGSSAWAVVGYSFLWVLAPSWVAGLPICGMLASFPSRSSGSHAEDPGKQTQRRPHPGAFGPDERGPHLAMSRCFFFSLSLLSRLHIKRKRGKNTLVGALDDFGRGG